MIAPAVAPGLGRAAERFAVDPALALHAGQTVATTQVADRLVAVRDLDAEALDLLIGQGGFVPRLDESGAAAARQIAEREVHLGRKRQDEP